MPDRPKRPCRKVGCPALVINGFCDTHTKTEATNCQRWIGTASSRGYDAAWQRKRLEILKRDKYLCQHCLKIGRATPADDVDHKIPLRVDSALRLEDDNLQSLCRQHHRTKTEQDKKLYPL